MSIYSYKLPFLQRSPRVWYDKDNLYARTSRWYQFLNACSYARTVQISKTEQKIFIRVRKFWFFTKISEISFGDIDYVDRTHWDVGQTYGLTSEGFGATDVTEVWYVRVFTNNSPTPISLFRFLGDGTRMTGWFGVIFGGDSVIDFEGIQDIKSERYAKLVAEYTGSIYKS
jgi:hypothetical protein